MVARKDGPMEPVRFEVRRDEEAGLWYAVAVGDLGIVTEAETLEGLRERLKQLVPDFLDLDCDCPVELAICGDDEPPVVEAPPR
jgi:hypothetical protein